MDLKLNLGVIEMFNVIASNSSITITLLSIAITLRSVSSITNTIT